MVRVLSFIVDMSTIPLLRYRETPTPFLAGISFALCQKTRITEQNMWRTCGGSVAEWLGRRI